MMRHWWPFLLLFAAKVCAHDVVLSGVARMESGLLIKGGTLIVYEYRGFGMPDVKILAVRATDLDGRFEIHLSGVRGDLDIRLVDDHCQWKGGSVILRRTEFRRVRRHEVQIVASDDRCDS